MAEGGAYERWQEALVLDAEDDGALGRLQLVESGYLVGDRVQRSEQPWPQRGGARTLREVEHRLGAVAT